MKGKVSYKDSRKCRTLDEFTTKWCPKCEAFFGKDHECFVKGKEE